MQANAKAYVKMCDKYQRYNNIPRQPSEYLTPIVAFWPFTQWGLDILGPFPMGMDDTSNLLGNLSYGQKEK